MLIRNTPAKINLFLNLRSQRPDGFHEVCFVMQTIGLWDTLMVTPEPPDSDVEGIRFSCSSPLLEADPEDNLVVKAYNLFWETMGRTPIPMKVHLDKRIPVQAGLGGGSSDAAAMLSLLNELTSGNLPIKILQAMAAKLGSDVSFFLTGGTAVATGRGEVIYPVPLGASTLCVVGVKPRDLGVSTADAYRWYREHGEYSDKPFDTLVERLAKAQTPEEIEPWLHNDFESVVFAAHPKLAEIAQKMRELGIGRPLLSGSGPTMVGLTPMAKVQDLKPSFAEAFPDRDYEVFWAHVLGV